MLKQICVFHISMSLLVNKQCVLLVYLTEYISYMILGAGKTDRLGKNISWNNKVMMKDYQAEQNTSIYYHGNHTLDHKPDYNLEIHSNCRTTILSPDILMPLMLVYNISFNHILRSFLTS